MGSDTGVAVGPASLVMLVYRPSREDATVRGFGRPGVQPGTQSIKA